MITHFVFKTVISFSFFFDPDLKEIKRSKEFI